MACRVLYTWASVGTPKGSKLVKCKRYVALVGKISCNIHIQYTANLEKIEYDLERSKMCSFYTPYPIYSRMAVLGPYEKGLLRIEKIGSADMAPLSAFKKASDAYCEGLKNYQYCGHMFC